MAVVTTPLGFQKPDGNELVKQGDNVIAANAQKAQDLHAKARADIVNLQAAAGFDGDPLVMQDAVVAELIGVGGTLTGAALNAAIETSPIAPDGGVRSVGKGELLVNVKDFGALGDGITDDGSAFQAAMDAAWGSFGQGGTLLIPPGRYNLLPRIRLRSNVNIDGYGATLTKSSTSAGYAVFHSRSDGKKGYASGDSNIIAKGIRFEGNFGSGIFICAFALHHSDNVRIEDCTFSQCISTAHIIDLNGCSNIEVTRCKFEGYLNAGGGYAKEEAIQIDLSIAGSASATDAAGSWDGLPTRDVYVHHNEFLPLTVGGTKYPAPNPIGSHAILEGAFFERIRFEDNYILDPLVDITSDVRGVIHFIGLSDSSISRNTVAFSIPSSCTIFGLYSTDWGTQKATANFESGAVNTPGTISPLYCRNVKVEGNKLRGFGNTLGAGQINIAPHAGGSAKTVARNIRILGNEFDLVSTSTAAATNFIAASYVEGLLLDGMNIFNGPGRPLNSTNITNLTVGKNSATAPRADAFRASDCVGVKISELEASACAGTAIYVSNSSKVQLASNNVASLSGSRAIALTAVSNFSVIDQTITVPAGVKGVEVYNGSANGRVTLCNVSGGTTTHVDVSAVTGGNVTETGNLKLTT